MTDTKSRRNSAIALEASPSGYMPPWTTPYIIGIGGTSGSGKTSVASKIVSSINVPWTVLISMDNFYKPLNAEERERAFNNNYDFDEPAAMDMDLAYECILSLKEGKKTNIPVYSFVNHNRVPDKSVTIYGTSVIVLEGIYTLYDQRLLDLMDLKIYVDADLDICLARRLSRDIVSRGRDLQGCIDQWERSVKPSSVKYVKPTMRNADAIVPSTSDNSVAIQLLVNHIESKLQIKSEEHITELLKLGKVASQPLEKISNLHLLEQTFQVKAIVTMLLDKDLNRDDFVFYFDRIAMLLISRALDDMPITTNNTLTTPNGYKIMNAIKGNYDEVAAVNIIRSGDCFMTSLKRTIPNITCGKLLIQSDSYTGEPQLHCNFLPPNLETYKRIFIMEAQVITGAALIMAIQILVDHDVPVENISVISYISTEIGIQRINNAFNGKINIYAAKIVTREQIASHKNIWALSRFVDSKYFGCG